MMGGNESYNYIYVGPIQIFSLSHSNEFSKNGNSICCLKI